MARVPEPLPELTLALRSLGSSRSRRGMGERGGVGAGLDHERFFAPLLEARRAAARSVDLESAVSSFDSARLRASLEKTIRAIAADHAQSRRLPARRALEARLQERVEPLRRALLELDERADELLQSADEDRAEAWRRWADQLRTVFACADRCWPSLEAALPTTTSPRRGLFARLFRRRRR
jgi:hypothetical protein